MTRTTMVLPLLALWCIGSVARAVPLAERPAVEVWQADRHHQAGVYAGNGAEGVALQLTWRAGARPLLEAMFPRRPALAAWQPGMEVALWVRDQPAGSVKAVALRVVDEKDEVYQFPARLDAKAQGWQRLTWRLDPGTAEAVYGGDKNRAFDGAPRWFGIVTVTRAKPEAPVHLWLSEQEGGAVEAAAAPTPGPASAPGASATPASTAKRTDHVQVQPLDAPPAEGGTLPHLLVDVTGGRGGLNPHAGERKKQSAQKAEGTLELRWEPGAAPLLELPVGGGKDLLAFDAGVTLSIPVNPDGYAGFEKMAVRAIDAHGETFQWPVRIDAARSGWRDVRVTLDPAAVETSYGGPEQHRGKINEPVRLASLLLLAPDKNGGSVRIGRISRNDFDPADIALATRLARVSLELARRANVPIFRSDEREPVKLTVTNNGAAEATFDLELSFEAFDGTVKPWTKAGVAVGPGQSMELEAASVLDAVGWYAVKPTLKVAGEEVAKPAMSLLYVAPLGARPHPPEEGFWLGIDARIGNVKRDAWQAELAALLGADHLRVGNTWPKIQPRPGAFDWADLDAELALLAEHGLKAVYGLTFTPEWAVLPGYAEELAQRIEQRGLSVKVGGASRMPPDPQAWQAFVAAAADHLSKRNVIAYELWNEPDLSGFYQGTTEQFLDLMRVAHNEVSARHPDALLLSAGIATVLGHGGQNLNPDLTRRSIVEGQDYYEAVALHQHGDFAAFQKAVDGPIASHRSQVRGGKPMFLTETGVWAGERVSRRQQAHELVKKITFARARGAVGFTWFVLQMGHEDRYALVTSGGKPEPYPQAAAFLELARMMRGRAFVRQHDLGSGAWVLEFAGKDDRVSVAWAERREAQGRLVVFAVPGGASAEAVDVMGNAQPLTTQGGLAALALSPEVRYVRVTGAGGAVAGTLASLSEVPMGEPGRRTQAAVALSNPTDTARTFDLTWRVGDGEPVTQSVEVAAGAAAERVALDLTMPAAARAGETQPVVSVAYQMRGTELAGTLSAPLRVAQLIPAGPADRPADFVLDRLDETVVNVNQADPNRAQYVWSGPDDLSVRVWLALEDAALVLRAEVRDDVHLQPNPPATMWKADGLQYALQLPGQAAHWEFGVGLRAEGPAAATYMAAQAGADPAAAFKVDTRMVDGGVSYSVTMPLEALGVDAAALRAGGVRFNLIVNDDDGGGREGWAQIADGVARSKDAALFPLVVFE